MELGKHRPAEAAGSGREVRIDSSPCVRPVCLSVRVAVGGGTRGLGRFPSHHHHHHTHRDKRGIVTCIVLCAGKF